VWCKKRSRECASQACAETRSVRDRYIGYMSLPAPAHPAAHCVLHGTPEAALLQARLQARVAAAQGFLQQYALPNFFFHLSLVYALLRQQGLPLSKGDFDGWHVYSRTRQPT